MLILHLAINASRFLFWAEKRAIEPFVPALRRGRKPKQLRPEPHPFAANVSDLQLVLQNIGVLGMVNEELAVAWLPTLGSKPLPSSPLISKTPTQGQPVLQPWRVPLCSLGSDAALELLIACRGRHTVAPGIIVGHDLTYWANTLGFVATLVGQGLFLPGIEADKRGNRACWQPFLTGDQQESLSTLASAMPASCRALNMGKQQPFESASTVLSAFTQEILDRIVRSTVDNNTLKSIRTLRKDLKGNPTFESLHDQWLYALASSDGNLTATISELEGLVRQLGEWKRRLFTVESGPLRLCFRLEEPQEGKENGEDFAKEFAETFIENTSKRVKEKSSAQWQVHFLLQSKLDPSLIFEAEDIWEPKKNSVIPAGIEIDKAREFLLVALGRACALYPELEQSLRTSTPSELELDASGAYNFLRQQAITLEMSGYRVFLPTWWSRKGTQLRLTAKAKLTSPKLKAGGEMSLQELMRFDWEIALGDQTLSQQDLQALAELKTPLIKLRGQWVQLSATEIKAALEFWRKKKKNNVYVRDAVQLALGGGKTPGGIEFAGVEADGWVGQLIDKLEGRERFQEAPIPKVMQGVLRPYQERGYSWLTFLQQFGLGACLADDMGLGKTIQTLAFLQAIKEDNRSKKSKYPDAPKDYEELKELKMGKKPSLLICPTSLLGNWQKEAARFTPDLTVMIHHGSDRMSGKDLEAETRKYDLVISSYGILQRDYEDFKRIDWATFILDEAQNIKNPETRQAKAARTIDAEFKIALTGTPVENNVGDLWSIMEFLNPGLLGNQSEFKRNFFLPIQATGNKAAAGRLKKLTTPFILRRLKSDKDIIQDLPEKQEMKVYCNLTQEQASLYKAVVNEVDETLDKAEGMERRGLILSTLSKLKQVCNHPAQFLKDNSETTGRSGKLSRLCEMLEEITANGEKALIFTQFAVMGEILQRHLQENMGLEIPFLHGGVSKNKRDKMVERFQSASEELPLFILSLKAGGTGLNLTEATHVFHFDRWWNPAVENQASDRAYRIGQTKNVQIHKFICAGTLEEKIDEMITRKQAVAEQVVGSGEGWLTELSTSELKELFTLSKEAVG